MRGDLEALGALMAPDLSWQWWEPGSGDCHSRDEALEVIHERLGQNAVGELIEVTEVKPDRVLVVTKMRPESEIGPEDLGLSPGHRETANVVTFHDGNVIAMQDYPTRDEAVEALHEGPRGD